MQSPSVPQPREGLLSSLLKSSHRAPPAQGPVPPHTVGASPTQHPITIFPNNGPLKLNWRRCNNMPQCVYPLSYSQPVALNNKLYFNCISSAIDSKTIVRVLEYTPRLDFWKILPIPLIFTSSFKLANLAGQLIAIGERTKSFGRSETVILIFDIISGKWALSKYASMPSEYAFSELKSSVVGYHNHLLIVAGGITPRGRISSVSILSTETNKWFQTEPLCYPDQYRVAIIDGFLILVGQTTRVVEQAKLTTLLLRNSKDVWKRLTDAHFYNLVPLAFGGKDLLVMGGSILVDTGPTNTIQQYNFDEWEWKNVGELAEPFINGCHYTEHCNKLYVIGKHDSVLFPNNSVYATEYELINN